MGRIEEIWAGDRLIQDFGMTLLEAREGYAKVSVPVRERFLNAHGIGHGVLLFAAADAGKFEFKENSYRKPFVISEKPEGRFYVINSALVGIAGSFVGYHLALLIGIAGYAALLVAVIGALAVLWGWRTVR